MIDRQVGWYKLLQTKPLVEAMVEDADPDPLLLAVERYGSVRKYAPMFLQACRFHSARRHDSLLAALDVLKLLSKDGRRAPPARFPVGHLREQTRRVISGQDKPDRRLYEIATLAGISGSIALRGRLAEGSRSYRPMEELIPMPAFRTLKGDGDLGLGVQSDGAAYLSEAAQVLGGLFDQRRHSTPKSILPIPVAPVITSLHWSPCSTNGSRKRSNIRLALSRCFIGPA